MTFTLHNEARVELMLYWGAHVPADEWIAKIVFKPDAYENYLDIATIEVRPGYEAYLKSAVVGHSFVVDQRGKDALERVEVSVQTLTEQVFDTMFEGQTFTLEQLAANLAVDMYFYADGTAKVPEVSAWHYLRRVIAACSAVAPVRDFA